LEKQKAIIIIDEINLKRKVDLRNQSRNPNMSKSMSQITLTCWC